MDAWKTYRSLNAEQKQILANKQLDVRKPVDALLALLRPLAACDNVANKSQTHFGCAFGVMIVMTVVAVIGFSNIGWGPLPLSVLVLFIGATVTFGYLWRWLAGIDVSNNLRSFVIPVLALFRDDIDPTAPVHLRLDLGKAIDPKKKTRESGPYERGVYHKVVDSFYVDPWMSAEAVLVDGTKLAWSVTDRIRERKKTKRNPRGKYKSKMKYRKVTDVDVQLSMKTKTYALANAELTGDGRRSKVEVQRSVRTDTLDPVDPRVLVDAIAGVYRSARPAKKEAHA